MRKIITPISNRSWSKETLKPSTSTLNQIMLFARLADKLFNSKINLKV